MLHADFGHYGVVPTWFPQGARLLLARDEAVDPQTRYDYSHKTPLLYFTQMH